MISRSFVSENKGFKEYDYKILEWAPHVLSRNIGHERGGRDGLPLSRARAREGKRRGMWHRALISRGPFFLRINVHVEGFQGR